LSACACGAKIPAIASVIAPDTTIAFNPAVNMRGLLCLFLCLWVNPTKDAVNQNGMVCSSVVQEENRGEMGKNQ